MPFFHALFTETNPGPVKEALYYMGLIEREIRLPLCALSEENSASLRELLKEHGLLR
jgi:4-hydroxy-tetrahydrodipicolinate synthase